MSMKPNSENHFYQEGYSHGFMAGQSTFLEQMVKMKQNEMKPIIMQYFAPSLTPENATQKVVATGTHAQPGAVVDDTRGFLLALGTYRNWLDNIHGIDKDMGFVLWCEKNINLAARNSEVGK